MCEITKYRSRIVLCLIALVMFLGELSSCRNSSISLNLDKEKQLVEDAIRSSIGWAKNKDLDVLYGVIANDSNFLEVHPNSRVVFGIENFRKAESFWMHPDFRAISYEIRDLRINISQSGTVAWFFCYLDDINEWKGQPANWENTRWTGVLEKRNGKWRTVQQHFSFASE